MGLLVITNSTKELLAVLKASFIPRLESFVRIFTQNEFLHRLYYQSVSDTDN